jgi:DNA invertase Pin-like site-specific DNA recombinase
LNNLEAIMKAVLYTRVSTIEQALHGYSLAAQEEKLRAYCLLAGMEIVAVIREEGVSGSKPLASRPGGKELMELLQSGVTHLVALKLDRLFRDAVDCLQQTRNWDRAGVSLHLVDFGGSTVNTGSAMGRMFLTMTAAFAELERNLISERTKLALSHLKANGTMLGAPALEDEETISRVMGLRAAGRTFREIAAILEAEGRPTLKGGKWAPATVRKIALRGMAA